MEKNSVFLKTALAGGKTFLFFKVVFVLVKIIIFREPAFCPKKKQSFLEKNIFLLRRFFS